MRTRSVGIVLAWTLAGVLAPDISRAQFAAQGQDVFATSTSLCVVINGRTYGSLVKAVDPGTAIGRSDVFIEGTPPDLLGAAVPIAGCPVCDPTVSDSDLTCFPAGAPETGSEREIHTEMLDLHLCHSCNVCMCGPPPAGCDELCYLAGQSAFNALSGVGQAGKYQNSYGEVESQNALGNPSADFPATSFFDVKGVVTISPAPGGTSGVFVLADPTDSIMMVNGNLVAFPPSPGDAYDIHAGTKAPGGGGGACSVCNIPLADAVSGITVGYVCCPIFHEAEPPPPEQPGCPTIEVVGDGSSSANERAPNSNFRFGRAVYLITRDELKASGIKNSGTLNSIGWRNATSGVPAIGSLDLYLENTDDTANNKSTDWATATGTMTHVSGGSASLPGSTTSYFDVFFTIDLNFHYTGGGLYVAFDWQWPGPVGSGAMVATDTSLLNGLKGANGTSSPPTTLAPSNFRPETRLTPATGLAQDISTDVVMTMGAIPISAVGPHTVRAAVTNRGASASSNVPMSLNVTGADAFSAGQLTIPLAACGGQTIVPFAPFTPTTMGTDSVRVSNPDDPVTNNDSKAKAMDVNPNRYSYKHAGTTATGGAGFNGATGQAVAVFRTNATTQIDAVTLEFFTAGAGTYRAVVYGESGGGSPGAQLYLDAADRTISAAGPVTIRLPSPITVSAGQYYAGIQQTNTTNAGLSFDREQPIRPVTFFAADSLSPSGPWADFSPDTPLKLNVGTIVGSCLAPMSVDVTPNGTSRTCAGGAPLTFSVAPSGGTGTKTYQWTENGIDIPGATNPTLVIGKISPGSFIYNCKVTDDGGCLSIVDPANATGTWSGNGGPCDDGNGCTSGESCSGTTCGGGSPVLPPSEALGVSASSKTTFNWAAVGGATRYDVLRGLVSALPVGPGGGDEACFDDLAGPSVADAATPPPSAGFWYLPRAENACGNGSYGTTHTGGTRSSTTCP